MAESGDTKSRRRRISDAEWDQIVRMIRDGEEINAFDDLWGRYETFEEFMHHLDATYADRPIDIKTRLRKMCKCRGGYAGLVVMWNKTHPPRP